MPEKPNENKIMAMLERRGIIRKAGDDEELSGAEQAEALPYDEDDIRALIEQPDDDPYKPKPAAKQPVPGITAPVFPSDKPQPLPREHSVTEVTDKPDMGALVGHSVPVSGPESEPVTVAISQPSAEYQQPAAIPVTAEDQQHEESHKSVPLAGSISPFRNDAPSEQHPVQAEALHGAATSAPPPVENYTDRYLNIEELFDVLSIKSKKTDTVYLIEEYLRTLPDSLPDASRRDIVLKIINASGFDYDLLLGDGVLRVKMLKEYAERFARYTDEYISARQAELDELDQQILRVRRLIENRRELHKKQFYSIEAEAQRLKEILTFISG